MNEFQKLVAHVRNLKKENISQATFDVNYLNTVLDTVAPSADAVKAQRKLNNTAIVGDGGKISNDGHAHLNLQTMDASLNTLASTFQVAAASRPLMSVGKLCDNGLDIVFKKDKAIVRAPDGATVCTFERQEGGLYVAKLRLKSQTPFGWPSYGL